MSELVEKLEDLRAQAEALLAKAQTSEETEAWYREYLGRKGALTEALQGIGRLPAEERPLVGKAANTIKVALTEALESQQQALAALEMEAELSAEGVDVTLPGRPQNLGRLHPSNATLREINDIFMQMGFQVYDAPEVETDEYNFALLNMPEGHPARDMWDTFYTTTPGVLLRTHTSPGQIHAMREYCPQPIRVILPGKCSRYEDVTARQDMMFYQVEGLAVGTDISFSDLKGTVIAFVEQMFGQGRRLRFRKSYFPFTEPSCEVDVECMLCGSAGCRVCKYTGWLEIMGAGMVNPVVLKNGGYDPSVYSGFAFGMGVERSAMLKLGIDDIRYFFSNDVRFLERVGV